MKTWKIENAKEVRLAESVLARKAGEVKLKIAKVAVSAADINYFAANSDDVKTPGHAAIAYVSESDADSGLKLGDRAVISPFIAREENGVKKIKVLGVDEEGLLSDFVTVPLEYVYVLPDGISDDEAVFTETISFGIKIIEKMDFKKGDYVAVVGACTLGLIVAQLAAYYQMVPVLIDLDAEKLKLAESWGIYYTLNPTYDNLERRIEEITGGRMCEFAVFAGAGVPFDASIRLVKDGGTALIGGYTSVGKHKADMDIVLKKELTIMGVCNGYGEMASAINLLANKIIHTDGIVSVRKSFASFPELVAECVEYPYQYNNILIEND